MAGKTYTQKIQFQGSFDGKEVLSGLKKIRQQMGDAGADASLFKGIDKDIAATEKLINDMLAQIQKGFSNPKEISAFEKQLEKLGLSFSKINVGLQDINQKANLNLNASDIQKYTKEIDKLKSAQDSLTQAAKDSIAAQAKSLGANKSEIKQIQDEVKANGDLENAIKKVAQAKEKDAKSKYGQRAVQTQEGKDLIKNSANRINVDDFQLGALSGRVKRGKNDARQRTASGRLTAPQGQPLVDVDKAQIALTEGYAKALTEVMQNGGNAADAIAILKQHMEEYGVEIKETEKLQESFAKDIDDFESAVPKTSGEKSSATKATRMGRTDSKGNFSFSQEAQDLINSNPELQAYMQNLQEVERIQATLTQTTQEGSNAQSVFNQRLEDSAQSQQQLESAGKDATESLKEQSEIAESINDKFDNLKSSIKTFLSITTVVQGLKSAIESTFEDIKELDAAFASIAMVTDYSVQQMWDSYDNYAEMANGLGQSTKDVIASSALFYQQGLETAEALELTESTMKLATLAGSDFETATSQMTAALRGFHMEMDQGERITDVYSELAAKAAADVEGIAYAMSKTASIASSAGMEFETTSAFLTQMIETTQEAPENIGTALKTVIARFTELKTNVAGTADSEFEDLDYNKVDKALKSIGVQLKDTNGQFRDLDDVFLELSQKWNTLDRNSQRYIATIAAGSRQQSRFIAMMENYDRTVELVDTAYNSAGRSSEQFAKYQDTLEYKMNQLKNTWEQFRTSFFNSKFFKGIIDGFNKILSKITELSGGKLVALGVAIVALGKIIASNLIPAVQKTVLNLQKIISTGLSKAFNLNSNKIQQLKIRVDVRKEKIDQLKKELAKLERDKIEFDSNNDKVMQDLKEIEAKIAEVEATGKTISFEDAAGKVGINDSNDIKNAQKRAEDRDALNQRIEDTNRQLLDEDALLGDDEKQLKDAEDRGEAIGTALVTGLSTAVVAVTTMDNPVAAMFSVIISSIATLLPSIIAEISAAGGAITTAFWTSTAGIGVIISAIIAVIAGLAVLVKNAFKNAGVDKLNKQIEESDKRIEELKEKQQELENSAKESKEAAKSAKELKDEFTELNQKQVLTADEQARYNELVQQIQSDYPEIVSYYNEITGELRVQNDLWESIIDSANQLAKEDAKKAYSSSLALSEEELNNAELKTEKKLKEVGYISYDYNDGYGQGTITLKEQAQEYYRQYAETWNSESQKYEKNDSYTNDDKMQAAINFYTGAYNSFQTAIDDAYKIRFGVDADEVADDTEYYENLATLMKEFATSDDLLNNLNEKYKEQKESINDELEARKELIKQQEAAALAQSLATSTGADISVTTLVANMQKNQEEFMDKEAYLDSIGNKGNRGWFADELGGGVKGPNDTSSNRKFTGANLKEWGKMDSDIRDVLKDAGMTEEEYNSLRKGASGIEEIYKTYTDQLYADAKQKFGEEEIAELTPEQEEKIKDFAANATTYTKNQLDEFINTESILPDGYAEELAREQIEAWTTATEQLQGWMGTENFDQDYYKNWTAQQLQLFNSSIEKIPASMRESYAEAMSDFFKDNDLTAEQAGVLLSIDPSTLDVLSLDTTKETYIANLEEMGMSTEDAEQTWKDYIDTVANYGANLAITNELGVEDFISRVEELRSTAIEAWDAISKAQKEYFEEGQVGLDSIQGLIEAGYGDYLSESIDGMVINQEDLMNAYFDSITKGGEALEEQIKQNEKSYEANLLRESSLEQQINNLTAKKVNGVITDKELADLDEYKAEMIELKSVLEGTIKSTTMLRDKLSFQDMLDVLAVKEAVEDFNQAVKDSEEEVSSSKDKYNDLSAEIIKLEESYNKANKELKEAQEGTDDYRSSIEELINYERRLTGFNNELEKSKELLADIGSIDDAKNLLGNITSLYENKMATLQAETRVLNQSLQNIDKEIFDNYADFVKLDEFGNMNVNFNALESAKMSNILKDEGFTQLFEKRNEVYDKINEKDKEYLEAQKEFEEMRSQFRDSQIKMENTVIDIIKNQMQEEVDAVTEKYSALEEADNDYLDALQEAIEKQRELREQQNEYEDLSTKEKKLSLLQRDTSGANQKEVLTLENEIQDDREQLLDNEIDNVIESMKELYEKQKEVRELEVEAMEEALENMQLINETAMTIISGFSTAEDYQAWLLENDSSTEDMTVTQTEAYLDEAKETFAGYAEYVAFSFEDFTLKTENINQQANVLFNNLSENATGAATSIQTSAEIAASEAVTAAKDAVDEAKKAWDKGIQDANETYETWQTAEKNLQKSRTDNITATETALETLSEMAKNESIAAAQTAVNTMLDLGVTADELINKYGMDEQFVQDTLAGKTASTNARGNSSLLEYAKQSVSADINNAINKMPNTTGETINKGVGSSVAFGVGGAVAQPTFILTYGGKQYTLHSVEDVLRNIQRAVGKSEDLHHLSIKKEGSPTKGTYLYDSSTNAEFSDKMETDIGALREYVSYINNLIGTGTFNSTSVVFPKVYRYKKGGLVDFTGPAWVDGTKKKPESFLNADDTKRIGEAARILSDIPILNSTSSAQNAVSTNIGDTTIEVHINVENVSSDYDVDRMLDRAKQDILDVCKPTGTPVILRK